MCLPYTVDCGQHESVVTETAADLLRVCLEIAGDDLHTLVTKELLTVHVALAQGGEYEQHVTLHLYINSIIVLCRVTHVGQDT